MDNNIIFEYFIFSLLLNGSQKLNCYNHAFKNYLQVHELDLKLVIVWKIKLKHLKVGEMFSQVNHPQPLKNDVIIGDTFEVFFQVQMIWHKLFWEAKRKQ